MRCFTLAVILWCTHCNADFISHRLLLGRSHDIFNHFNFNFPFVSFLILYFGCVFYFTLNVQPTRAWWNLPTAAAQNKKIFYQRLTHTKYATVLTHHCIYNCDFEMHTKRIPFIYFHISCPFPPFNFNSCFYWRNAEAIGALRLASIRYSFDKSCRFLRICQASLYVMPGKRDR